MFAHTTITNTIDLDAQAVKKRVSKGKYKYEKCTTWWYICQQGSHDFTGNRSNAYMVCHSCSAHPSGGPDGTGPDGEYFTPSGGSGGAVGSVGQINSNRLSGY